MSFDNRVFDINGVDDIHLKKAIELAFSIDSDNRMAKAYMVTEKHGLIFFAYKSDGVAANEFPVPLDASEAFDFAKEWLKSNSAHSVKLEGFFKSTNDSDVSEDWGWRVYLEEWGRVDRHWGVICAISPSWIWYGK
jgi:hypothetical protein